MIAEKVALAVPATAGAGTASYDVSSWVRIAIQIAGITASVIFVEATVDGSNWVAVTPTTAVNGIVSLDHFFGGATCVRYLRAHTTSIAGGETPIVTVLGQDSRTDGN
jgi:hypothetical protein